MIALKNKYKTTFIINWDTFVWVVMPFGFKKAPTYQWVVSTTFKDYLGIFMKLFLDYFNVFNDLNTHLTNLWFCFDKYKKYGISLNPNKYIFCSLRCHLGLHCIQRGQAIGFKNDFGYYPYAYPENTLRTFKFSMAWHSTTNVSLRSLLSSWLPLPSC
jgi:hypothetical protein